MTPPQNQHEIALLDNLKPGLTAYRCTRCSHLVGDDRTVDEWHGHCPPEAKGGCHNETVFEKINEQ